VPQVKRDVKIVNKYGLHARPAMKFVELANQFTSKIEVSNGVLTVDAKSIMSVMRLAAVQGTVLKIVADGTDAKSAAAALGGLVEGGFDEMTPDETNIPSIEP
jgi:phosphotransferase system HPr (HPr) family protein